MGSEGSALDKGHLFGNIAQQAVRSWRYNQWSLHFKIQDMVKIRQMMRSVLLITMYLQIVSHQ